MSDTSQGPGWWVASDGKWYPPEQMPQPQPPQATPVAPVVVPAPVGADAPMGPGWWQATDGRWYPPQPGAYPAGPNQYPAGPKKPVYKRVWFWLLVVLALGIGGCVTIVSVASVAVDHAAHINHTVVYTVSGTGSASSITYSTFQEGNGQNGENQLTDVSLPWSKTITASGLLTAFDVTAAVGAGGGSLTCTITEDGKQIATGSASGAFTIASCNSTGR